MSRIGSAIHEIQHMDTLAARDQWVNRIHPLVKFIVTFFYIAVTVSFSRYDVIGTMGMVIYPLSMFLLADLSIGDSLRRLRLVLPLVCLVGIWNPFFDRNVIQIAGWEMSAGVLSMATLILKGVCTVLATYLLIATTSMEKICYGLQLLHLPRAVVIQFMLTYRYVSLLLQEADRITQAYALRAPNQRGIHFRAWGSLVGRLLLRSMDRAGEVYESMLLRGYRGDYGYLRGKVDFGGRDGAYLLFWLAVIVVVRRYPVMLLAGNLAGGWLM